MTFIKILEESNVDLTLRFLEHEESSKYTVRPEAAYYNSDLGEFILPYEAVRTAEETDAVLLEFLQSTYEAAADLADWDRDALERKADPKFK